MVRKQTQTKYTICRDSREQQGWIFNSSANCTGTIVKGLKTGDYTLIGYESILCVVRKGSLREFAGNIIQARFDRELERMESFALSFLILEFSMDDIMRWPISSGLPPYLRTKIKINKYFILKRLLEIETDYKTKVILAGPYGKEVATNVFKRTIELYGKVDQNK
jgi:hypothetical protein